MLPPSSNFLEQWDGRHCVFLSNVLEQLSFKIHHGIYQPRLAPALTCCMWFHVAAERAWLVQNGPHCLNLTVTGLGRPQHWTLGMSQDVLWSSFGKVAPYTGRRKGFFSAERKTHRKLSPLLILKKSSHIPAEGHSDCFNWSSGSILGCSLTCHTLNVQWMNCTPQELQWHSWRPARSTEQ